MPAGSSRAQSPCSPSCGVTGGEIEGVVHASTVASNTVLEGLGRADRARDDEGLPRRARDAPPADPGALRHPVSEPAAARSPPPPVRGHRAARPAGRDVDGARRGDRARGRGADPSRTTSRPSRSPCSTPTPTTRTSGASRRSSASPSATRVYVTRSSEILPEIREYERTSTAVVNAYVGPAIAPLPRLARRPSVRGGHRRTARGDAVERRHARRPRRRGASRRTSSSRGLRPG